MNNLVDTLVQVVLKFTEEVQKLRKDNEFLKSSISRFAAAVPTLSAQTSNSALCGPFTPGGKSYRDVASAIATQGIRSSRPFAESAVCNSCQQFFGKAYNLEE
jgi:hypothetical protein